MPGSAQEGYAQLACPIFSPPHPLSDRIAPLPIHSSPVPPSSFYPSFNNALSVANRIGIPKTIGNLKRLELAEHTKDPRPLKRARTPDDDVISLDSSGDELDEELVALVLGPSKSRYAALKIILSKTLTKAHSVLKQVHSLALDLNSKSDLFAAPLNEDKYSC